MRRWALLPLLFGAALLGLFTADVAAGGGADFWLHCSSVPIVCNEESPPTETVTETLPGSTVTDTVTEPGSTETVTDTVTEPGSTETVTDTATVTETETETQTNTVTDTETVTVTETQPPPPTSASSTSSSPATSASTTTPAAPGTCDLNATPSNLVSQITAALPGWTICLASGSYGTWQGTNKAITLRAADGAVPTMNVNFGSGDSSFTLDGMRNMGGDVNGAVNVTIRNSTFTSPIDFGGNNVNVVLDHNDLTWNGNSGSQGSQKILAESSGTHSVANPSLTISNNAITNGDLDGVRVGNVSGLLVLDNTFADLCDRNTNHTDNIQFYGSSSQVRIAGNYVHATCTTQGISSYDGGTNGILIEDNVVDIRRSWGIEFYTDRNSIIRHNTIRWYAPGCYGNQPCGLIDINRKSANAAGSGTQVYDNVAIVTVNNGSTVARNDHNVSGQNVTYVGPLTTYAGFRLVSPKGTASDGLNVGIR